MTEALDWLCEVHLRSPHLLKALIAGTLVSSVCGLIGCFIVLRRTAFLADALAHTMLPGVVCGYLFMKLAFGADAHAPAMVVGSILAGLLTVMLVQLVSRTTRLKEDAVIGIMYTGLFAAGGVLLSLFSQYVHMDLAHFLTGQLLAVEDADLWMMALVAAGVLAVVILFFRHLQLITFDPVMAASIGVPVAALSYALTICTSLVVVAGVNVVGIILVVGLLIIPASSAYLLCDRLSRMLAMSALLGWTSFLLGYGSSEWLNVAPGSAVVVASALQFLGIYVFAPRYGVLADWRRRRRTAPQHLVEDVLGAILRQPQERATAQQLAGLVEGTSAGVTKAIGWLLREGMLQSEGEQLTLTSEGRGEATRLVRAHRLWETYLDELGAPSEALHSQAHVLEHVHDASALDYLDDKLGHPLRDPHGSAIPADQLRRQPGARLRASLLREGDRARVAEAGGAAEATGLRVGDRLVAGPREQNDTVWTVRCGGRTIRLNHQAADDLIVQWESAEPQPQPDA